MNNKVVAVAAIASIALLHGGEALAQAAQAVQPMGFFITSVGKGDGGNLGGLAGADAHCQQLATAAGSTRQWAAYLSAQAVGNAPAVNAKDRIGTGPWYNQKGVLIATNVTTLHNPGNINKATALNEKGGAVNGRGDMPNQHDILTGTQQDGTAFAPGTDRACSNWTSNIAGQGGAMMGHHDLQGNATTNYWNFSHASNGCSQQNVMQGGGNGYFYCFARQ